MKINATLFELFEHKAKETLVTHLCMGLGYTAVATEDGGIGIAYTFFEGKTTCMVQKEYENPEGKPAIGLVEHILSDNPIRRTQALAAINALNHAAAISFAQSPDNNDLLEHLGVGKGTHVAMVGAFAPLIRLIREKEAELELLDTGKGVGDEAAFYKKMGNWADVLMLTATTLLNNTTEAVLGHVGAGVRTVLLGPSTPLVKEAFTGLPVHLLAGTVPVDAKETIRAVRHGTGTPVIQKFGRKVVMAL
ncbi:MAG: Rossmann-like domain-containing protein [Thermodesulfobacteriota bacterium]